MNEPVQVYLPVKKIGRKREREKQPATG